ncbi:MAG: hypothetical protein F6K25_30915 [Okeania sp. SIO2G4]|nr:MULTISPECIES: hypothetical protein [unclassified Okeania]NEP47245.1 hypothetical protein [Okeania sp. SIO2H7]NEP75942.1 hypothetical protein [Okeania sp. SIO2G5]NEP97119.1 hypothetical protein [Okeania sp. SIO2F5]NEQ94805.1 hypothetical protein [Okeania sp. SIO2G4]
MAIATFMQQSHRDLPVSGFDPNAFNYEFNWVAETYCLEHNVRATKDQ